MSNKIKILSENIINKIASGEVIKRPSSVLKELLENSIDAGSNKIDIILLNSGKTIIKIIDNGIGMNLEDSCISFKRHATSKIQTYLDLFRINTKGFRGEALADISEVSQLELFTRDKDSEVGVHIIIENGNIIKKKFIEKSIGSIFLVKNIFFNMPSRRCFLKSSSIEFNHIINEFNRIAIPHNNIKFNFYHNNKKIISLNPSSFKERIFLLFNKIDKDLISVYKKYDKIIIKGFISKPYFKKNENKKFIFINNRFINNSSLHKTILNVYKLFFKKQFYVSYFILIFIDSKYFNLNIHPSKIEVEFQDENLINEIIQSAIENSINKFNLINNNLPLVYEKTFELDNNKNILESKKININYDYIFKQKNNNIINNSLFNKIFNTIKYQDIKLIQFCRKYFLILLDSELILINYNRAHQRILYEKLFNLYNKKLIIEQLLIPFEIKMSFKELEILKFLKKDLKKIGFIINFFDTYIKVKAIPHYIKQKNIIDIINNFILKINFKDIKNYKKFLISHISKYLSIKSNVKLNFIEIKNIINKLLLCNDSFYSPFGKKIFIFLDKNSIDKFFL